MQHEALLRVGKNSIRCKRTCNQFASNKNHTYAKGGGGGDLLLLRPGRPSHVLAPGYLRQFPRVVVIGLCGVLIIR